MIATATDPNRLVSAPVRLPATVPVPEEWLSHWERPYTRAGWLDLVPTVGGFSRHPEAIRRELLDRFGAAVDAAGGSFTMHYTTVAVTAARTSAA